MSPPTDESTSPPSGEGDDDLPMADGVVEKTGAPDKGDGGSHHDVSSSSSHQTLHDLLSSGEIESALSRSSIPPTKEEETPSNARGNSNDVGGLAMRLPLLLRWLSVAQPLATLSSSVDDKKEGISSESSTFADPNVIVPLLEDVAAAHPDAENVEVCVSALAPSVCKDAFGNNRSPLSRNKTANTFLQRQMMGVSGPVEGSLTTWNTAKLDNALASINNPTSANAPLKRQKEQSDADVVKKQKVKEESDPLLEKMMMVIDILEQDDGNDGLDDQDDTEEEAAAPPSFFAQASSAANDSHESAMRKVLQELISLIKSSLCTSNDVSGSSNDGGGADNEGVQSSSPGNSTQFFRETGFLTPGLTLKSDSLFAETHELSSSLGGGWSRLSVMIPTLMQHAPVLRHEHVANALCRATVPQAPMLIKDMAANCPAATQCLLRGCVTAYQLAERFEFLSSNDKTTVPSEEVEMHTSASDSAVAKDIMRTSVESTKRLASLSPREALNVIRILHEERVMDGLVLSLLMEHNPIGSASFIVEKLSSSFLSGSLSPRRVPPVTTETLQQSRKRSLPLRQRVINNQSDGIDQPLARAYAPKRPVTSHLYQKLVEDKALAEKTRGFISQCIIRLLKNSQSIESISAGEGALYIQAYALLIYFVGIGAGSSSGSGSKLVEDTMNAIRNISGIESTGQDFPAESSTDNMYQAAICAVIITCARYPPIGDSKGSVLGGPAVKSCLECLRGLLLQPKSTESIIFSSRVAGTIIDEDANSLSEISVEHIFPRNVSTKSGCREGNDPQMANVCHWLLSKIDLGELRDIHSKGLTLNSVLHDPITAVEAMRQSKSQKANELDDLMKKILADQKFCAKIVQNENGYALVQESVKMMLRRAAPHIPIVLPLSIERLAQNLPWDNSGTNNHIAQQSQFVLQAVYALEFLDRQPQSPFVTNPRLLPLKETLAFLDSCSKNRRKGQGSGFGKLVTALQKLASKHCPDIVLANDSFVDTQIERGDLTAILRHTVNPMMVSNAIRDCINGGSTADPSGLRAEKIFMICRSKYPSLEVDVAAVGAILASVKSQPKFYSYLALCKDPLVVLKAKAAAWTFRGVRSILLRILENLMSANECMAMQSSATESVALEYLTARDTIIVRCIVFACASGFNFGTNETCGTPHSKHCMLSVSMIRSIVSKRRGIIAALVKQDLPDMCIDWIVEFVPESLSDAPSIAFLLSDKGLLTATERLTAASVGLRIAVAHSPRGEETAKNLMMASTAVLLDSFALVVGPIGVPVSVLREENGQDVTNICRKAMFDMLKTFSTISPKNTDLRNEASITLSKIASQCKNENAVGGITGVAAARRKALLKEIWEKCLQANTALGGAMQM